jgi:NAD-dependent SIR2 family protein deacetylase
METVPCEVPNGYHLFRDQTKAYDEGAISLVIFNKDEREFLERFRWLRQVPEFCKPEDQFSVMSNVEAAKKLNKCTELPD